MLNLRDLGNPSEFWEYFEQISKIPRCSGKEEQIRNYVKSEAEKFEFETKIDKAGNLLVRITSKNDKNPIIILQSHLDMVCEKNEKTIHDFSKDPLKLKIIEINGKKWLTADGTTLGADNGVGIAYQLAFMKKIHNGELEFGNIGLDLLFTVNEEDGLIGAFQIDKDLIKGNSLINLDGEREDIITIGCAGGILTNAKIKLDTIQINQEGDELEAMKIIITGLIGGHSGADIHRGRANAIKLIARILWKLNNNFCIYVNSINGGKRHNAIPRESNSIIYIRKKESTEIIDYINKLTTEMKLEFSSIENNLDISIQKLVDIDINKVLSKETQNKILNILYIMPNGPISMHPYIKNLVLTSTNLASILTKKHRMIVITSQRSFEVFSNLIISEKIMALFKLTDLNIKLKTIGGYGGWKPDFSSNLLKISKETYKELFNEEVNAKAFHVGLEPGVFKIKFPEVEMISIGPNTIGPHSPDERLEIKSVEKLWKFLIKLLKNLN